MRHTLRILFVLDIQAGNGLYPKNVLDDECHPRTGNAEKYIVEVKVSLILDKHSKSQPQDRFHLKNFPNKNPDCRHHDPNLCNQLKTATTSHQENLNAVKNSLRLRSTCTRTPDRHLMYNMVCILVKTIPHKSFKSKQKSLKNL